VLNLLSVDRNLGCFHFWVETKEIKSRVSKR